jgi:hypothetical protein
MDQSNHRVDTSSHGHTPANERATRAGAKLSLRSLPRVPRLSFGISTRVRASPKRPHLKIVPSIASVGEDITVPQAALKTNYVQWNHDGRLNDRGGNTGMHILEAVLSLVYFFANATNKKR